jgi:hypothetical protein
MKEEVFVSCYISNIKCYISLTRTNYYGFIEEFKEFSLKGTVLYLAIAVTIEAAFGAIVSF